MSSTKVLTTKILEGAEKLSRVNAGKVNTREERCWKTTEKILKTLNNQERS